VRLTVMATSGAISSLAKQIGPDHMPGAGLAGWGAGPDRAAAHPQEPGPPPASCLADARGAWRQFTVCGAVPEEPL